MTRKPRINIKSIVNMMDPIDKNERRRKRERKRMKDRQTIFDIIKLVCIMAAIVAGGYYQRGYWCLGAEWFVVLPGIAVILARRADWRL